jgi:hypothetical protein
LPPQVPGELWHWSGGDVQVTVPAHVPAPLQRSFAVQARPSSHVLSAALTPQVPSSLHSRHGPIAAQAAALQVGSGSLQALLRQTLPA